MADRRRRRDLAARPQAGVASEATAVYRDVSAYPEPLRSRLRGAVENYVDTLINVAWPNQQRGETSVSLPAALWWVLIGGALINLVLMSMLAVERLGPHLVISGLFAVFIAMMIFLIVAMDNPFLGEFSVTPAPFEQLQQTLFGRA